MLKTGKQDSLDAVGCAVERFGWHKSQKMNATGGDGGSDRSGGNTWALLNGRAQAELADSPYADDSNVAIAAKAAAYGKERGIRRTILRADSPTEVATLSKRKRRVSNCIAPS